MDNKTSKAKKSSPKKINTKNDKLTAAEIWKDVARKLEGRKYEEKWKKEEKCHVDLLRIRKKFEDIHNSMKEGMRLKSDDELDKYFYRTQFENSVRNISNYKAYPEYVPLNPIHVPDFFPKKPLHIFEGPDIYHKLDIDTLFFIFYHLPNTISQYFAAKQLKRYSWRYHTKYNTWFQRLEEPKLITEDYEQGVFLFFDYDVTWSNRKKNDFTFEYKYLENIEI